MENFLNREALFEETNQRKFYDDDAYSKKFFISSKVSSMLSFLFASNYPLSCMVFYCFYYHAGYLNRKKLNLSNEIENLFASYNGTPSIYFDVLELLRNKQYPLEKIISYIRSIIRKKVEYMKFPTFKRILNSVCSFDLISNINKIILKDYPDIEFLKSLTQNKRLAKFIRFLAETKSLSGPVATIFSPTEKLFLKEKYKLDLNEIYILFCIAKNCLSFDFTDVFFLDGKDYQSVEIVRCMLLIENEHVNLEKVTISNNIFFEGKLFLNLNLDPLLCWLSIMLRKGKLEFAKQLFPLFHSGETMHSQISILDTTIDLIKLQHKEILNTNQLIFQTKLKSKDGKVWSEHKKEGLSEFLRGSLGYSPLVYLLLNGGDINPNIFHQKFMFEFGASKLNFFTFFVYLNFKILDILKIEFLFDYIYVKKVCRLISQFRRSDSVSMKSKQGLCKYFDERLKSLDFVMDEMIKNNAFFCPVADLKACMNETEKIIWKKLTKEESNKHPNFSDTELVNLLLNKCLIEKFRSKTSDANLREILTLVLYKDETLSEPFQAYMKDPTRNENGTWEIFFSNNYYIRTFMKFFKDEICESIKTLNEQEESKNNSNFGSNTTMCFDELINFGVGFFVISLAHRMKRFISDEPETLVSNFNVILFHTDVLFRFVEKISFFCNCSFLTQKFKMIITYLLAYGIVLRPCHTLTFSAHMYTPTNVLYLYKKVKKLAKINNMNEFMQIMRNFAPSQSFLLKLRLLRKIMKNDVERGMINVIFRSFSYSASAKSEPFSDDINLKFDLRKVLQNTKLYNMDFELNPTMANFFYVDDSIANFDAMNKTELYSKVASAKFDPYSCHMKMCEYRLIKAEYLLVQYEDLFQFCYGKAFDDHKYWQNINKYLNDYANLYRSSKVLIFRLQDIFVYNPNVVNYKNLSDETRALLKIVYLLQYCKSDFHSDEFQQALNMIGSKLRSEIHSFTVILEYLLSKTCRCLLRRFFLDFRNVEHQRQTGQNFHEDYQQLVESHESKNVS